MSECFLRLSQKFKSSLTQHVIRTKVR